MHIYEQKIMMKKLKIIHLIKKCLKISKNAKTINKQQQQAMTELLKSCLVSLWLQEDNWQLEELESIQGAAYVLEAVAEHSRSHCMSGPYQLA